MLGDVCLMFTLLVGLAYISLILLLYRGGSKALIPNNVSRVTSQNDIFTSIIVPVRNEEMNLQTLLFCMEQQGYPANLYEVIVVNDHSEDNTINILNQLKEKTQINIENIDLTDLSGKKEAIAAGVRKAKGALLITVDADCEYGSEWLETIVLHHAQQQKDFYILPVTNRNPVNFFEQFQGLEFLTLIGVGIASFGLGDPILCNGANLCFTKKCFEKVNGYQGNLDQSSGDDVFLLHKVKHQKELFIDLIMNEKVYAVTGPKESFKSLIHQRVRWAKKSDIYKDKFTTILGIILLAVNVYLFTGLILSWFIPFLGIGVMSLFALRVVVDWLYLRRILKWFNWPASFKSFLFFEILYPFYAIFVLMAALSFKPEWKGRKINTHQINKA